MAMTMSDKHLIIFSRRKFQRRSLKVPSFDCNSQNNVHFISMFNPPPHLLNYNCLTPKVTSYWFKYWTKQLTPETKVLGFSDSDSFYI